jgi:fatty-acyl-CoA synthase
MFHANSWGLPYGAVMLGIRIVLPGPNLHPDDLLDLMQLEPPTLSLGVPTIWMGLIQAYERSLTEQPGALEAAGRDALAGRRARPCPRP